MMADEKVNRLQFCNSHFIVAHYFTVLTQLQYIIAQVIGKGVVVIKYEHHKCAAQS